MKAHDEGEVAPEMQEAIANWFERQNGDASAVEPTSLLSSDLQNEWQSSVALLNVPNRAKAVQPNVEKAWQSFRSSKFEAVADSLGEYVADALAQNPNEAVKQSGLPKPTLEALKRDGTPLKSLKGYELNDYADLARRYGVGDSAFPRMLKWLKGLGKNFMATGGNSGGLVFARDEDTRKQGLSEADLAEHLGDGLENKGEE